MKHKKVQKDKKPFHLHVEHFFRMRFVLIPVLILMLVAMLKTDSRLMGMLREVYAQGYGLVGSYMREETTRTPITFSTYVRTPTISGH